MKHLIFKLIITFSKYNIYNENITRIISLRCCRLVRNFINPLQFSSSKTCWHDLNSIIIWLYFGLKLTFTKTLGIVNCFTSLRLDYLYFRSEHFSKIWPDWKFLSTLQIFYCVTLSIALYIFLNIPLISQVTFHTILFSNL